MMHHHAVQHAASAASELGLGFTDKRNRNPNWTDHEIIRFLDILQEEKVLKDLMAQRNKQVIDITIFESDRVNKKCKMSAFYSA